MQTGSATIWLWKKLEMPSKFPKYLVSPTLVHYFKLAEERAVSAICGTLIINNVSNAHQQQQYLPPLNIANVAPNFMARGRRSCRLNKKVQRAFLNFQNCHYFTLNWHFSTHVLLGVLFTKIQLGINMLSENHSVCYWNIPLKKIS